MKISVKTILFLVQDINSFLLFMPNLLLAQYCCSAGLCFNHGVPSCQQACPCVIFNYLCDWAINPQQLNTKRMIKIMGIRHEVEGLFDKFPQDMNFEVFLFLKFN